VEGVRVGGRDDLIAGVDDEPRTWPQERDALGEGARWAVTGEDEERGRGVEEGSEQRRARVLDDDDGGALSGVEATSELSSGRPLGARDIDVSRCDLISDEDRGSMSRRREDRGERGV
jgi:hypothetical protein